MKDNWSLTIRGKHVSLVPYRCEHVPTYHSWMQDPWLREMTCSEEMSLQEEIDMQEEWREDPKKCTFIIIDNSRLKDPSGRICIRESVPAMVGDVNLFLSEFEPDSDIEDEEYDDEDDEYQYQAAQEGISGYSPHDPKNDQGTVQGELNVMIADPSGRRRGLGKEALQLMMHYGATSLGIRRFVAKISVANTASLRLFSQVLGFRRYHHVACFGETELHYWVEHADPSSRANGDICAPATVPPSGGDGENVTSSDGSVSNAAPVARPRPSTALVQCWRSRRWNRLEGAWNESRACVVPIDEGEDEAGVVGAAGEANSSGAV